MDRHPWIREFLEQTDFAYLGLCATCSAISVYSIYSIYCTMSAVDDVKVVIVQMAASFIGIVAALLISIIDYRELCEWYKVHSALTYGLMILTAFIGFAPAGTTNKAWISLPFGLTLQPSELLKISMIITLAHFIAKYKENINEINTLLKLAVIAAIPFGLVTYQKDGGTMLVFFFIIISMFFAAGISWKLVGLGVGAVAVGFPFVWFFTDFIEDYQKNRILAILFPDNPAYSTVLDQQNAGKISIGSGQLFGKGFMTEGHNTVPLPQNDFIFSFIAESVGFVGMLIVIGIILFMCFRILVIANRSADMEGTLICVGVFAMLIFQSIINIGMNLSVLPVIGITLPLFSAGGTSVVATYCSVGLVLSVARHNKRKLF